MLTAGESRIRTIVATWMDESGATFVIAPCGNCRQFMLDVDAANLECNVVLDAGRAVSLRGLLPSRDSWQRQ